MTTNDCDADVGRIVSIDIEVSPSRRTFPRPDDPDLKLSVGLGFQDLADPSTKTTIYITPDEIHGELPAGLKFEQPTNTKEVLILVIELLKTWQPHLVSYITDFDVRTFKGQLKVHGLYVDDNNPVQFDLFRKLDAKYYWYFVEVWVSPE